MTIGLERDEVGESCEFLTPESYDMILSAMQAKIDSLKAELAEARKPCCLTCQRYT